MAQLKNFGKVTLTDTVPSVTDSDTVLLRKETGNPVEATLTEMGHVFIREFTFTEALGGAGQTYSAAVNVPAGAYVLDVIVHGLAVWDDTGACTLNVGTSTPNDPNGYFSAINLKATDLLVGEYLRSSDISGWGGKEGVYLTAAGLQTSYSATARVVTATATSANGNGSAGSTRFVVIYAVPQSTTAATQAAT